MTIGKWITEHASTILTWIGAGGTAATVIFAVKATPKAMHRIESAKIDKGEAILNGEIDGEVTRNEDGSYNMPRLTIFETVKACWKEYVPAALCEAGTLACIFGANAIGTRRQANLSAALAAAVGAGEAYKEKVRSMCGPGTDEAVERAIAQEEQDREDGRPPWDEIQTFYIEFGKKSWFFEKTMEEVVNAEYALNRYFALAGEASFNEFLALLGQDPVDGGNEKGWTQYVGEVKYGYKWINFYHRYFTTGDGMLACHIDMPFGPHSLDEEP